MNDALKNETVEQVRASQEEAIEKDRAAREAAKSLETYEFGFHSDIEQEFADKGLSEDTVRFI